MVTVFGEDERMTMVEEMEEGWSGAEEICMAEE